jgi:hypothetical protein
MPVNGQERILRDARSALIRNFHFGDSGSANIMIFNHRKIDYWVLDDDDDRRRASFERHSAVGETIVVTKDPPMQSLDLIYSHIWDYSMHQVL